MGKHTKTSLQKLENIIKEQNYTIIYEKGTFNSGYCIVEDKNVIVINRFYDTDGRVQILLDILIHKLDIEDSLDEKSKQFIKYLLKDQLKSDA
ncbi:MAG: hypothetical protein R2774_02130 [Saprospiraceae bacterium]